MVLLELRRWLAVVAAPVALAVALLGPGLRLGAAQETPGEAHPAHIHTGSCDQLGDVEFPLTDVSFTGMMTGMMGAMESMHGTPEAGMPMMGTPVVDVGEMRGAATAEPVETSFTVVDTSIDELLDSPHAINVHESADNIQNYIACGDIGGTPVTVTMEGMEGMEGSEGMPKHGPTLLFGLHELNGSGHHGVAILMGYGDQTAVIVLLAHGAAGDEMASPTAG
jgi:hypothetical protein